MKRLLSVAALAAFIFAAAFTGAQTEPVPQAFSFDAVVQPVSDADRAYLMTAVIKHSETGEVLSAPKIVFEAGGGPATVQSRTPAGLMFEGTIEVSGDGKKALLSSTLGPEGRPFFRQTVAVELSAS